MYCAQLYRGEQEDEPKFLYAVYKPHHSQIDEELEKVTRSGDVIKVWYGTLGLDGQFYSESEEPYNEYYIDWRVTKGLF